MAGVKLTLLSANDVQTIELYPSNADQSIVDTITRNPCRVYQDQDYRIRLDFEELSDVNSFYLALNDEIVSIKIAPDGSLQTSQDDSRVFSQCYGYVRFQLFYSKDGKRGLLESPFISVMVKKGIKNESVKRMTEYIYRNNSILLSNSINTTKYEKDNSEGSNKTIETKLSLLKRIISTLETNYAYFKINSRFKTVHIEKTDYFDKLQFVSAATIQYIAQHPDELRRTNTNTGIVIGGHRYQPERTLITQNAISYDTEENRAIVGFIERLSYDVQQLKKEIHALIEANEYDSYEEDEYISSTYYIYISTIDVLRKMEAQADEFTKRILAVQLAYSRVFNLKPQRMINMPKPTAIFMSVPQYKQLYDCMNEWLKYADVGLQIQNQILGLKKISEIYELYVLLKLIRYVISIGYDITDSERITYEFSRRSQYKNTLSNNRFVFSKGEESLTLYYQPVLYSGRDDPDYGVGLYRNNTVSIGGETDESYSGEYYTPDYVIKYQNPNYSGTRFFVLDAKFMTKDNVLKYQLPTLAFKYIFSVSPIDLKDRIMGLYIVNGQSEQLEDSTSNVYDRSRNEGMIMPRAEIITLTENSVDNYDAHVQLLTSSLGRFL